MTARMIRNDTEAGILAALAANSGWMTQREIRKATGQTLTMHALAGITLGLALDGRVNRRLSDDHETAYFRAWAPADISYGEGSPWCRAHGHTGLLPGTCAGCAALVAEPGFAAVLGTVHSPNGAPLTGR